MNLKDYPLWTAIITPMLDSGDVDYESFAKLLKEQEAAKNGVLILGSTGESLNINEDERRRILTFTLEQKLNVPIMVGVGGVNLQETKVWVEHLETMPFHCYLYVTPLYAKPGPEGQYQWFKELMDLSTKPVILYNVPSRTGMKMSFDAVEKLKNHENFFGIKEASGSTEDFKNFREIAPDTMLFSGDDALLPEFSELGANGLISVASNVWPQETHLYVDKCLDHSLQEKDLWRDCSNALFIASNPIPAKALLKDLGRITSNTLRAPLTSDDLFNHEPLTKADGKIKHWYEINKK